MKDQELDGRCDMRLQVTLTAPEGKRIIAKGIANLDVVKKATKGGSIFFKGGTTVSAVAEEITGQPLSISGRITLRGTVGPREPTGKFHCALYNKGILKDIDGNLEEVASSLKKDDVAILGANAFDVSGNAVMMMGRGLGAGPGKVISGIIGEIQNVIVAVGLEKLIPGSVIDAIKVVGRKSVDFSYGMAVGLIPIVGQIITEREAILNLVKVDCHIIGKGGILGAEGSTTLVIEGKEKEIRKIFKIIKSTRNSKTSGIRETLLECRPGVERCKNHIGCIYKRRVMNERFGV